MNFLPKDLDVGFIIICADSNTSLLKGTAKSIKNRYSGHPYIGVVEQGTSKEEINDLKEICPIYKGKKTITSLINTGMRNGNKEWNLIVIAGSWLVGTEVKRFSHFVENEKDILFPIIDQIGDFERGSINGILLHKKTFKEVGPLSDNNPLHLCKRIWALDAAAKGCKFKAILGPKIC
jgi:hypothetical protein